MSIINYFIIYIKIIMSRTRRKGRLGNTIVRNLAVSKFAEKFDLYVSYYNKEIVESIGFKLYCGKKKYDKTLKVNDNDYLNLLNGEEFLYNINSHCIYYQTKEITDLLHSDLNTDKYMNHIINNNNFKQRYNNNNDCFVHIRLGDVEEWNPGFEYYDNIISKLKVDNIYIATDSNNHNIINKLKNKYNNHKIMGNDLAEIFKFGSTCKYVILSYGTFSAMIGYISFYSTVYYKKYNSKHKWDEKASNECDMFRGHSTKIGSWIEVP